MRKILAAIMLMTTFTVWAGDYEDGLTAFERKDYTTAVEKFTTAAEQGNARAYLHLGVMYLNGTGVAQDESKGLQLLSVAARSFSGDELNDLVAVALNETLTLLATRVEYSARRGNSSGQNFLGLMHSKGIGVSQDHAEAFNWYELAALQGYALAQHNLGQLYSQGVGVEQNGALAIYWYKLAAAQGFAESQMMLGAKYAIGQGVAENYVRAYMWGALSAIQGFNPATKLIDLITTLMTPQQIAQAQKLAQECLARNYKNCD